MHPHRSFAFFLFLFAICPVFGSKVEAVTRQSGQGVATHAVAKDTDKVEEDIFYDFPEPDENGDVFYDIPEKDPNEFFNTRQTSQDSGDELNVNVCISLINFYEEIRKKRFTPSYNPLSLVTYLQKQPEFGWIKAADLDKAFIAFIDRFLLDLKDKTDDPEKFSRELGERIGALYSPKTQCTAVSKASGLVYRLIEYEFVPRPREFLAALLSKMNDKFRSLFYLFNFQIFLKCSKEIVDEMISKMVSNEAQLREDFLDVYEEMLQLGRKATAVEKRNYLIDRIKVLSRTGLIFGSMFLYYHLSTYIPTSENQRWVLDNVILYKFYAFYDLATKQFQQGKAREYLSTIELALSKGKGGNGQVQTNDHLEFGNAMLKAEDHSAHCQECLLRKQAKDLKAQKNKKGGKKAAIRIIV